jgi:glutathione S-transferase
MALLYRPAFPWLLYAYPWMPYPRRVIIYLREKGIPDSLVKVAVVADPQDRNQVLDRSLPPIPSGSLPILAISSEAK